jgi:hypothetical protein
MALVGVFFAFVHKPSSIWHTHPAPSPAQSASAWHVPWQKPSPMIEEVVVSSS